jgi:lysophospholipase L1-like esterase
MTQILVFGSSTTYGAWDIEGGWVQRLRKWLDKIVIDSNYKEYHIVYNLGIDGDTSSGLLKRFEQEAKPRIWPDEDTVLIFSIGANDTVWDNKTKKTEISPAEFKKNLEELVKLAKKYTKKIVFVGSKPIDESKVNPIPWLPGKSYKKKYIKQFDEISKKVFEGNNLPFIDLYDRLESEGFLKMLADGIHPNSEGHKKIFEIVKDNLIQLNYLDL